MGYTHYWNFEKVKGGLSQESLNAIASDVEKIEKHVSGKTSKSAGGCYYDEVQLFDGRGEKPGVYFVKDRNGDCREILFNGDDSKDLSHETFYLSLGNSGFEFCKTARKPYDIAVCLSLLSVKHHVPDVKVSSDGGEDDWEEAKEMFKEIFPKREVTLKL